MSIKNRSDSAFRYDGMLLVASLGCAILLVQTGVLENVFLLTESFEWLGAFIAGLLFTSIFTTAPAIVALGEIARLHPILPVALFGALGAVIGDVIIFRFIRDRFSDHLLELVEHRQVGKRLRALLKSRIFRLLSLFVGGLIIASPLPDELGISLMSFSKLRTSWFIPLSFFFNFIGILSIGLIARSL